ncbi:MAG TPA: LarC family nickel insertion protein [Chloroflexota bacterium]|nr:LarC family nickel insertion protein [Chloroflexota bacterium]
MSEPDGQHHDHDREHPHPHPHPHPEPHAPSRPPAAPPTRPTPLIYVDCFSGISGDMLLGALLDAGLPLDTLQAGLAKLDLGGYRLGVQTKQSYGITGTKLDVLVDEAVQPERRLAEILDLLRRSDLPPWVHESAEAVFRRLGEAEAKIHATTVDAIHFHEVGGVDSIVDIVGGLIGLHALGVTRIHASSLPLPGGTVRARHGLLPAPAPATLEILAQVGAPTRPAPVLGELVTPTGAAILAELATFEQPTMRVHRVGYGYGTKELPWPNAVRVWLGEPWAPAPPRLPATSNLNQTYHGAPQSDLPWGPLPPRPHGPPAPLSGAERGEADHRLPLSAPERDVGTADVRAAQRPGGEIFRRDEVVVIEANLDDATPELLGYAMERLFEAGALDVFFTPIQMKKNRPGTLLGVIGRPERASALAEVVLRETTTLGVRLRRSERLIAERRQETVLTPFGPVRVKLKLLGDRTIAAPEYDDCAEVARAHRVPLSEVYRAAQLAATSITTGSAE